MSIGTRIREAREKHGWTQAELAERAEAIQTVISFYENGRREPNAAHIRRLALALGVSSDWLLGIDDGPCAARLMDIDEAYRLGMRHQREAAALGRAT